MANQNEKPLETNGTDPFQCEYIPFGGDEKIKLSFNFIRRWIAAKTKKGFEAGEQDVMKFLMVCKAKRLNPFDGDAYLVGYDTNDGPVFSTIVAHQAFLKRAETHPEFDGMESGVIVRVGDEFKYLVGDFFPPGATLMGGWATVFFVNRRHPMTKRLRLSTFDKGRSLWKTNPEGMIVKCAEADALRSSFPQLIGGMYLREEMDAGNAQAAPSRAAALEDRRSEQTPSHFSDMTREQTFYDRGGSPVKGYRAERYPQDAAAAEAAERIRGKPAYAGEQSTPAPEEAVAVATAAELPFRGVHGELMARCLEVGSVAAGVVLQKEISAHLAGKNITDEEACDLNGFLEDSLAALS